MNELRVFDRISDAVGWTPLVRLGPTVDDLGCDFGGPHGRIDSLVAGGGDKSAGVSDDQGMFSDVGVHVESRTRRAAHNAGNHGLLR